LSHLLSMEHLQILNLSKTKITDQDLETLKRLKELKELSVKGTGVTAKGAKKFLEENPDCEVEYGKVE
jgi:hypothetical protein